MKLDTNKIPGFAEMSAEEKLDAVLSYEFEVEAPASNQSAELEQLKAALSKSNSEAADYKRQLRARQTDEEAKAAKEAEERAEMMKELDALRKEKVISGHKASYLSLGYDEETAEANAKALHSGDFATVFQNHKAFLEAQKKVAISNAMDKQPGLTVGEPITKDNVGDPFISEMRKFAGLPGR